MQLRIVAHDANLNQPAAIQITVKESTLQK